MKTSLDYAAAACDVLVKKFTPTALPPAGRFHYHQGVFLSGMQNVYRLTGDEKYYNYIKAWVNSVIDENGVVSGFSSDELDDIQPGILLFDLYERTGDKRYKTALDAFSELLRSWDRNSEGGFWHKREFKNQMWLDGMYMAGPIMAEYGVKYNCPAFFDDIHLQMSLMKKHCRDEKTGLFYHVWDSEKNAAWADSTTGLSQEFWGRAIGWYAVAMFEIAELLPKDYSKRRDFIDTGVELLLALLKYQDRESGLWYQVVDKPEREDNWMETSCSCLFLYALCKAIRMGCLADTYKSEAKKGFEGIIDFLGTTADGDLAVRGVCVGTGPGDYSHYIARPTSENDLHGVGAFTLMCCEYYKLFGE